MSRRLLAAPYRAIDRLLDRRVPATGLALFRIVYSTVLAGEILQIFHYRQLIFDPVPFLQPLEVDLAPVLLAWLAAALCLVLGLATRTAAVVNYVMTLATLSVFHDFEYHFDYAMTGANFLLLFIPVEAALSVDRLLARRRCRGRLAARRVSVLGYYSLIVLGVGFVYVDSLFHKVTSPMWLQGLGLWLPASLPQMTWLDLSPLLDVRPLVIFLGYLTVAFEAVFLFLFFRKRFRVPLLAVGLGLHLGICLAFPIPFFGLGVVAFYILMVPFAWWEALGVPWGKSRGAAGGDEMISSHRRWRVRAVAGLAALLGFLQLACIYRSPFFAPTWQSLERFALGRAWHAVVTATVSPSRVLFGITPHNVFMDYHFAGYERVLALSHRAADGTETWLPIVDREGHAAYPAWGRMWVHWAFRVNSPRPERGAFERGACRFTAFWAAGSGVDAGAGNFLVHLKKIDATPEAWQEGFLRRQLARPWTEAGRLAWSGGRCRIRWADAGIFDR